MSDVSRWYDEMYPVIDAPALPPRATPLEFGATYQRAVNRAIYDRMVTASGIYEVAQGRAKP